MNVKIKKLHPDAVVPTYATPGSACFDLYAIETAWVADTCEVEVGLAFEVPQDHAMLVFSRSGHGFKEGIRLSNCVAVIDADFRGPLKLKLRADAGLSSEHGIEPGNRVAQAMILPVEQVSFEVVDQLSTTERGEGGMGSTGL